MDLYCNTCNEQLTVEPLREADLNSLQGSDGVQAVPAGYFATAEQFDFDFRVKITHIVNTGSLRLSDHSDPSRFVGCCGAGMLNKYNQVCCKCSATIGLIYNDCIGPHFTAINADRLTTKPKW